MLDNAIFVNRLTIIPSKYQSKTPLMIANNRFRILFLDLCGLLQSDNHFKYILVAVDSCSRFLWVWPQRSADTRTVIKDLRRLVVMGAFHLDNGPAFASKRL